MTYGYIKTDRPTQSTGKQLKDILDRNNDAKIVEESPDGGHKEFSRLLRKLRNGDTLITASVTKLAPRHEEAAIIYQKLCGRSINLQFLKEPHLNTETFTSAIARLNMNSKKNPLTGKEVAKATEIAHLIVEEQIKTAYEESEKNHAGLSERTRQGMLLARLGGKQIGSEKGSRYTTKKSVEIKKTIELYSQDFRGSMPDTALIRLCGCSRGSFYKYKKELREGR